MALMDVVSWDGVPLNGSGELQFGREPGVSWSYAASATLQARPRRTPTLSSMEPQARVMPFWVAPSPDMVQTDAGIRAFVEQVHGLFRVGGGLRPLVARRDGDDGDTAMVCYAEVQSFEQAPSAALPLLFEGELIVPDGEWRSLTPTTVSESPIELSGNGDARPVVTLTSSATGSRVRVTATDRTGHGVGGWLAGVAWSHPEGETWVYANGVPLPFVVTGGRLWFRLDINAGQPTVVDAYWIDDSDNSVLAGELDPAGTTLNAALAAGTSVTASTATAGQHAVSAALTWQPGITAAHNSDAPYTFGLSAPNAITLIDRTATGSRQQLADDADSLVFTSPVEITQVSAFPVTVTSGYRLAEAVGDEADTANAVQTQNTLNGPACLRVKIGGLSGGSFTGNYSITGPVPPNSLKVDIDVPVGVNTENVYPDPMNPHRDDPWPEARVRLILALAGSQADLIRDNRGQIEHPTDPEVAPIRVRAATVSYNGISEALQRVVDSSATVTSDGESWIWYITFPEGSQRGQEIPFLSVAQNTVDIATLIEQVWVDPVSLKPIVDNRDGGTPPNGQVRAVARYRLRDDESWYTYWSQVVNGVLSQEPQTFTIPAKSIPEGAVQIAVGLESSANGANAIDWGVLTVDTAPTLTFMSGKSPLVTVSSAIDAQKLDGTLRINGRTAVTLDGVLCDGGVRVDADTLWVDGADGLGPVYGDAGFAEQANWVVLRGDVTVETTGTIDGWEATYADRWLI